MPQTNASNATSTQTSVSLTASSLLYEPFPQPLFAAVGQIIDPLFAQALGMDEKRVDNLAYRGKRRLREWLKEEGRDRE